MRRTYILTGGVILAAALALAAILFLRPITITVGEQTIPAGRFAWTVGQALRSAGVPVYTGDRVTPGLNSPIPFNRAITLQRATRVYLWENSRVTEITGMEPSAGDLLRSAGVTLGPSDRLSWNGRPITATEVLPAGRPLVLQLQRAANITMDVNGETRQVESLGPTFARALWDAGIRPGPADRLSIDPGLPLSENEGVAYLPARPLTIKAGGQPFTMRTTAATVGQALAEAGLALQGIDYSLPAANEPIPTGGQVRVVRVREEIALAETLLPYGSKSEIDPELELDTSRVTVPGQYGVKVLRERIRYEDGQETARVADSEWVASQPVDEVLGYGTKVVVKTLDVPGGPIEYYRAVQVYATSYSPCRLGTGDGRCGYTTASGATLDKGIIAVRLSWYRMLAGQRVYVPGYGFAVIADVGGGIPGRYWIDLGFSETNYQPIVGWTTLYFLTPVPANVPWALP